MMNYITVISFHKIYVLISQFQGFPDSATANIYGKVHVNFKSFRHQVTQAYRTIILRHKLI
jgi:hypothetical protein